MIECIDCKIRAYSIHLTHINAKTRIQQVETILNIDRNAVMEGGPISGKAEETDFNNQSNAQSLRRESLLMGDFNFTPESEEYSLIAGPSSDYGGRVTNPEGFVDAWVAAGNKEETGETAERRGYPVRMDFCFVRSSLSNRIQSASIDSEAIGSDHKPFSVEIEI